jgi:hypothetical protein
MDDATGKKYEEYDTKLYSIFIAFNSQGETIST